MTAVGLLGMQTWALCRPDPEGKPSSLNVVARRSLRETEFLFLRRSRRLRTSDFWLVSTNLSNQHHRITRRALQFNFYYLQRIQIYVRCPNLSITTRI